MIPVIGTSSDGVRLAEHIEMGYGPLAASARVLDIPCEKRGTLQARASSARDNYWVTSGHLK